VHLVGFTIEIYCVCLLVIYFLPFSTHGLYIVFMLCHILLMWARIWIQFMLPDGAWWHQWMSWEAEWHLCPTWENCGQLEAMMASVIYRLLKFMIRQQIPGHLYHPCVLMKEVLVLAWFLCFNWHGKKVSILYTDISATFQKSYLHNERISRHVIFAGSLKLGHIKW